ncbi:MAG: hypothetical protein ACE5QV_07345, partial [Fidelibacterota bacterium]
MYFKSAPKILIILAVILAIYSPAPIHPQEKIPSYKEKIAILDFSYENITEQGLYSFLDRIKDALVLKQELLLIPRDSVISKLKKWDFQQIADCNSPPCLVKAGRLLGVQKVIGGSISRVGTKYFIEARMVDVLNRRVLSHAMDEFQGP